MARIRPLLPALLLLAPSFAAAPPLAAQRAYVTEVFDGTLSVVDLRHKPARVLATVPAGELPVAVAVERHGRLLFVSSLFDGSVAVFDLRVLPPVLVTRIAVGGELGGLAASPTADRLYVAKFDANQLAVIDTAAAPPALIHTIAAGEEPDGIVFSADGTRAYVANAEDDLATASTVSVIDATQSPPAVIGSIPVDPEPHGIVLTAAGRLLVASADLSTVTMIDAATQQVVDTLELDALSRPYSLALSPAGDRLYVTDAEADGKIFAVGIAGNELTLLQTYPFGSASFTIDVLPDGKVAAGHRAAQELRILDFSTDPATQVNFAATGDFPSSFGKFVHPEPPGFADGFESGDTAAWSFAVP